MRTLDSDDDLLISKHPLTDMNIYTFVHCVCQIMDKVQKIEGVAIVRGCNFPDPCERWRRSQKSSTPSTAGRMDGVDPVTPLCSPTHTNPWLDMVRDPE